jgi:acyl carrier protein
MITFQEFRRTFMEQNHEQILSTLKNIARDKLELDFKEVDVNMSVVDDLGLNSLTIFDFIYETEKTFQIELDEKSLLKVKTVSDMVELIRKSLY